MARIVRVGTGCRAAMREGCGVNGGVVDCPAFQVEVDRQELIVLQRHCGQNVPPVFGRCGARLEIAGDLGVMAGRIPDARTTLVGALSASFGTEQGESPLAQVVLRLAQSLVRSFEVKKPMLAFPRTLLPLEVPADDTP